MDYQNSPAFARSLDEQDELRSFREEFLFPEMGGRQAIYLTGNSLGLQPKGAREAIERELEDWARLGVEGHFHARHPWYAYHERFSLPSGRLVGAFPEEVVVMNSLTTNLHLMMVSFYRPTSSRYKILCEAKAFPSDQYALASQAHFHGHDPEEAIVALEPREGEHTIRTEDILEKIEELGDSLALVLFGGVNYYTGQAFDMPAITKAGHDQGAMVGFDLAHAAGNLQLELHNWEVDFAVWCSYKYLNSGPGSVGGCFVHQNHVAEKNLPRFAGWWGHDKEERFRMAPGFQPMASAEGWQLSNAPVLSMAVHATALEQFERAGMDRLVRKREKLTGYMEFLLRDISERNEQTELEVITPQDPVQRGAQLSILAHGAGKELFRELTRKGVSVDWREPNVIRVAPVPMYTSFEDVQEFGRILEEALNKKSRD